VLRAFDRWSQDSRISISSIKPQWKQAADDYMTYECRADAFESMQGDHPVPLRNRKRPAGLENRFG